jgi:predicted MPP superfamily phosphohydrolase
MKRYIFPIVLISILLIAELGSYFAIRNFFVEQKSQLKWFNWIWIVTTGLIYALVFWSRSSSINWVKNWFVNIFFLILIAKLVIGLVFILAIGVQFIKDLFLTKATTSEVEPDLNRRKFAAKIALGFAALPLGAMTWGIIKTAYDFKIHRPKIKFSNLPNAFHGFKIVQISDIHTGSLQGKQQLQIAIDLILAEKPDVIFFTGDLVNTKADEALPYVSILGQLNAPYGVFSILGNHDYGDYEQWDSSEAKQQNMQQMYGLHKELGWRLLLNEHIQLEKEGQKIGVLGIENWGANLNFKKYGKFKEAHKGSDDLPFKILLSHDPSHYNAEIKDRYKDIDLTLSGHTHGFQFGVEIPGFKWSPSQYIYPQWAGLYPNGNQYLYVNRGLGCLGYMGRVGIRPEITVIELQATNV